MKPIFLFLLTAFVLNLTVTAQSINNNQVPSAIATSFKSKFPLAINITWKIESTDVYEANFNLDNENQVDTSASFDTIGTWMKTTTRINTGAIPHVVQTAIWKEFPKVALKEATKIENAQDGISYYVEISNLIEAYDVLFSSDGKMLSHTRIR